MKQAKRAKIFYGIIGCGEAFRKHAEAIRKNKESALAAVFDTDSRRAGIVSKNYGCEKSASVDAMLADRGIDAVVICTPHDTHKDLVLRTIQAGKYAVCEKPLALSSREGRALLQSRYYKQNIITVFQTRFSPAARLLFRLLASGKIGTVLLCNVHVYKYRDRDYFNKRWRSDRGRSGGMLLSQGIHALDMMRLLCGWPKRIMAIRKNFRPRLKEVEDVYAAAVEFRNGAVGTVTVTTAAKHNRNAHSIFIAGSRGSMEIGGHAFEKIIHRDLRGTRICLAGFPERSDHEFFLSAVNDFILRKKRDPLLSFAEDAVRSVAFVEELQHALGQKH